MTTENGERQGDGARTRNRRRLVAAVFLVVVGLSVAVSGVVLATRGTYVDVVGLRGG